MKFRDLPLGTKFLFCWHEDAYTDHIGTINKKGVASCNCGMSLETNVEDEVHPIIEWEDEL